MYRLFTIVFVLTTCCLFAVNPLIAATPEIIVIQPAGLTRGGLTELTISGARLGDPHDLLFYQPGLEIKAIVPVDDKTFKVTIEAKPDATCELHPFRLITKTGVSNVRYIGVSPYTSIPEVEPNNEFKAPQVIPINATIDGIVKNEDVDYYAVDVSQGQTISVEIEGIRHYYTPNQEGNFLDPFVAILDAKRFELARSDDHSLFQQDGHCAAIAPADGRYIIQVRDSSFGGNDRGIYRLHVSQYSRPIGILPGGANANETIEATCIDVLGKEWNESFSLTPTTYSDRLGVWSIANLSKENQTPPLLPTIPSPNRLRISNHKNIIEAEPNEDYNTQPVHDQFPIAFNGRIQSKGDRDWYVIAAKKDQQLEMRLYGRNLLRSPIDGVVEVVKVNGPYIVGADDTGGPDSQVTFKAPEDGSYAISVRDHLGNGGPDFIYRLEVESPTPNLEVTINEQQRYFSQFVAIPKGARMAIEANLVRKFVGGEGKFEIGGLPLGVTMDDATVPADLGTVPIMFRATADAESKSTLADITGSIQINPETKLVGHLNQKSYIVRGQNEVDVWSHQANRLAVAVLDPVPFDIEVVQPGVPLVRDGTLNLIVKAKRNEGFANPIHVYLLYAPPGVAASGSIVMPGDKSEIEIPLTANGGAAIRKWPITVIAATDIGQGPMKIASNFIELDVTDRLFNFNFTKTMAEQGKPADVIIGLKMQREVEGTAEIELLGPPPGTTLAEPKQTLAPGTEQLVFKLGIPADTKTGNFKTIACRATVTSSKGVITQINGTAEVQIDVPPPAPVAMPEPSVAEQPPAPEMTAQAAPPVEKPLTRLEQLKKQREAKN